MSKTIHTRHRPILLQFTLVLLAVCFASGVALAVDSEPITIDFDVSEMERVVVVGATLGEDWDGFPHLLAADSPRRVLTTCSM